MFEICSACRGFCSPKPECPCFVTHSFHSSSLKEFPLQRMETLSRFIYCCGFFSSSKIKTTLVAESHLYIFCIENASSGDNPVFCSEGGASLHQNPLPCQCSNQHGVLSIFFQFTMIPADCCNWDHAYRCCLSVASHASKSQYLGYQDLKKLNEKYLVYPRRKS